MEPQVLAVTPVAQASVHVTVVLLEPETVAVNCSVVLVTTLEVVGEIVSVTVVGLLPPHPNVPSAIARVSIEYNFHRLIPVLPAFLGIRSSRTGFSLLDLFPLHDKTSHRLKVGAAKVLKFKLPHRL
jgi:hypothetical protein